MKIVLAVIGCLLIIVSVGYLVGLFTTAKALNNIKM
jgi:hypothetical protein